LTVAKVSVGSVLQSGQQLITLVPSDAPLEVEANIAGRDDGYVHVGDPVAVKFDTFPFTQYGMAYGSPRMTHELRSNGLLVGRRRTARLMRENGLVARQKRRFKRTTDSEHAWPVAPNLLEQDFTATRVDEKWGADISYIWTREGWLFLAVVIDLFSRRVVGWATADRLHRDLALSALRRALAIRCPTAGLIHHSDRGSQYCSMEYQALLKSHGAQISMSGKGNCYDNAMVETFFKTVKSELVWRTVFETRDEATAMIGRYIDRFYNPTRRHSALAFMSPVHYEMTATV
jgi:transposase InsO family protein